MKNRKLIRARTRDVAYPFRMPTGIPGDVTRLDGSTIETQQIQAAGQTGAPAAYGIPVFMDAASHAVRSVATPDAAAFGVLVRSYPTGASLGGSNDPLGTSTPPTSGPVDVLVRGYITVKVVGAPVKGGPVYIWTAVASGSHVQGGFEAADPGGSGFKVPNSYFTGPADASGFVELAFNI